MSPFSTTEDSGSSRGLDQLIHLFFLVSGATALTYEIVWTRQFVLILGATTPAVSLVLALFMGGLAFGAWRFGVLADRTRNLLRWYGAMEFAIGLFALLQPWALAKLGGFYARLLPNLPAHGLWILTVRGLLAGTLLLIPTSLMGGTFPVLVRFMSLENGRMPRNLGTLYGANLVGAVVGSALTGFVLIKALGVQGTLHWAVVLNLGLGLFAWLLSMQHHPKPSVEEGHFSGTIPGAQALDGRLDRVLWVTILGSGFLTMGYEVAWSRMLVFSLSSTVYTFTLILVVFLLGLALGAHLYTRLEKRGQGPRQLMVFQLLAAIASLVLASIASKFPAWEKAFAQASNYSGGGHLAFSLFGCALVMIIPVTFMGFVFPMGSRLLLGVDAEISAVKVGRVYWVNTLGSILGSLITGFLLIPHLSVKGCLLALAGTQGVLALAILPWARLSLRSMGLLGAIGGGAIGLAAYWYLAILPGPNPFDSPDTQLGTAAVIEAHRDDPSASVTVVRTTGGTRIMRINGFAATTDASQAAYMPMMSHLPLLLHGSAHDVLVICVGTGSTAGAALLHPGVHVDAVDINASVLEFAPLFVKANHGLVGHARARLIQDDGRNYLVATRKTYDIITSEPMPPTYAGVVNLYSREYYELAHARLNKGGILVQWLPAHLVTPREAQGILHAVQAVFPETTLWVHADTGLIVARKDAPVRIDLRTITTAYLQPKLAADLTSLGVPSPSEFVQLFALGPEGVRALVGSTPPITDDKPSLEFHNPRSEHTRLLGSRVAPMWWASAQRIYELRGVERLPLIGVPPDVFDSAQKAFQLRSAFLSGSIWLDVGGLQAAERYFAQGLVLSGTSDERGEFLFRLSLVAYRNGDIQKAESLLARCLTETPRKQIALNFMAFLSNQSQPSLGQRTPGS